MPTQNSPISELTKVELGGVLFYGAVASCLWTPKEQACEFKDRLQRNYFVDRLFEHFQQPGTPLRRIAILGSWGTGKTVVLDLLKRKLRKSNYPQFGVAMINPWIAQTSEEVHTMIAQAFEEALGYRDYFRTNWGTRFGWLSWLTGIKAGSGPELTLDLKQLFHGGSSAQEENLINRINRTLGAVKRVCVILVDDMERAEPEIIRKVFPVIDMLRRIKPCFFVFGIDPVRIARAFEEQSRSSDQTKGYLDKVFDLQIELPQVRPKDLALLCGDLIDERQTPKLKAVWSSLAPHISENPREAKHFLNDAITKEMLFLSRYGPDEHDYIGFFKLRMLELEQPGIAERISVDLTKPERRF